MTYIPNTITSEIKNYFDPILAKDPSRFVCMYGSSLYKQDSQRSDFDMFLAEGHVSSLVEDEVSLIAGFIKNLHIKHDRKTDEEVPYENKVYYSAQEITSAVTLAPFEEVDGRLTVPKVIKDSVFLQSAAIKGRLLLNALTTPHMPIGADLRRYHGVRLSAEDSITRLALDLAKNEENTVSDLYSALTVGPDGETGEMFLGYKIEHPSVKDYLEGVIDDGLSRLHARNRVRMIGQIGLERHLNG